MTMAPTTTPTPSLPATPIAQNLAGSPFDHDRFLLKQKHLSLTEKYAIFDEHDRQIFFVRREAHHLRQIGALLGALFAGGAVAAAIIAPTVMLLDGKKQEDLIIGIILGAAVLGIVAMIVVGIWLSPKRHIGFFTDQSMKSEVLTVLQDQKVAFINATYTAADADLNLIGWYRKNYLYNIFRKRWYIYNAQGEMICVCMEDSVIRSIIRRVLKDYAVFMRTNFIILGPDLQTKLGEFNRKFTLFDKYVLDLTADGQRKLDRRMAVGLAVLLDTAEKR